MTTKPDCSKWLTSLSATILDIISAASLLRLRPSKRVGILHSANLTSRPERNKNNYHAQIALIGERRILKRNLFPSAWLVFEPRQSCSRSIARGRRAGGESGGLFCFAGVH